MCRPKFLCIITFLILLNTLTVLQGALVELTVANLTSSVKDWEKDIAVMFYAPWCKYCKQLAPSMQSISALLADNKNLVVGKFNCEPTSNTKLCQELSIERYPSIFFFGYGNFNQAPKGNIFGKPKYPSIVKFNSDMYAEAIYDWIRMLSGLSYVNRIRDDVVLFFKGTSRAARKAERLAKENSELQRKVNLFSSELEKYKADELFDSLKDRGDPFPLLASLEPDEQNLPFRYCVAEMAQEYCKYHSDEEKYCKIVDTCAEQHMKPKACRPNKCPFDGARGCVVVSACMDPGVIEEYKKALSPAAAAATSSSASSVQAAGRKVSIETPAA